MGNFRSGFLGHFTGVRPLARPCARVCLHERLGWHRMATAAQEWGPHGMVDVHCYAAPGPYPPHPVRHPR